MQPEALPAAIRDAFRPFGFDARAESVVAASFSHQRLVKFEDFRNFVVGSNAVQGHLQCSAVAHVLADAISALCGTEHDALKGFVNLSRESLAEAVLAAAPGMLLALCDVQIGLSHMLSKSAAKCASADGSKFQTTKMACGSVSDFHQGLTARIGSSVLLLETAAMRL
jgi:hypothetical protein